MRHAPFHADFPRDYEVEILDELPSGGGLRRFYFPGGCEHGGHDGLLVRVTPSNGADWLGVFASGSRVRRGATGVFTTPRPGWLCVVSRGQGTWVCASEPSTSESVDMEPILGVLAAPDEGRLVFHDYTELLALNDEGVAWRTPRLSWDGLDAVAVDGSQIKGMSWSSPENRWLPFEVALDSGRHRGGAYQS